MALSRKQIATTVVNDGLWRLGTEEDHFIDKFDGFANAKKHEDEADQFVLIKNGVELEYSSDKVKPFKLPFSYLTKTIECYGQEFIPIEQLLRMKFGGIIPQGKHISFSKALFEISAWTSDNFKIGEVFYTGQKVLRNSGSVLYLMKEWNFITNENPQDVILVNDENNPYW